MPRAALGHLATPLFVVLRPARRSFPGPPAGSRRPAAGGATGGRPAGPEVEGPANPARELARRIGRTFPLVWGGGALGAVAAYRWKADVNENAKAPAF